jgi:hypothetical protein
MTVEIRRNDDGTVDEVVAENCSVHIEQMNNTDWWMQIGSEVFWFSHVKINGKWNVVLKHTETRS